RVTGTDLMYAILKHAEEQKLKVYGIIRKGGLSTKEEIMVMMHKRYPLLKYQLRYSGEGEVEKMIDQYKPDIIFVGLGFPDQEKWIAHHLRKFGYVKVFVGIGGAFDFLSEKTTRAPKLIRNSGFEWLWRLIKHPNRIKRIFNAVIIFPLRVLFKKQNG
ncbi:MAG: WecB/TagA/CpsF family glycosyltransferase, partial [Patescibacteria group bacterium]